MGSLGGDVLRRALFFPLLLLTLPLIAVGPSVSAGQVAERVSGELFVVITIEDIDGDITRLAIRDGAAATFQDTESGLYLKIIPSVIDELSGDVLLNVKAGRESTTAPKQITEDLTALVGAWKYVFPDSSLAIRVDRLTRQSNPLQREGGTQCDLARPGSGNLMPGGQENCCVTCGSKTFCGCGVETPCGACCGSCC